MTTAAAYWAAQARAALTAARRDLCSHGVTPANCREPHDLARREDTDTEETP